MARNIEDASDRIIVALDTTDWDLFQNTVMDLKGHVGFFKVGLEAFIAFGPKAVEQITLVGGQVFLDLKFHDIPTTVRKATMAAVSKLGVHMINAHCSGGVVALQEAASEKGDALLLGVTVLTSHDDQQSMKIFGSPSQQTVQRFAHDAKAAGCDGVVCSPQEIALIRSDPGLRDLLLVTPGVRPSWASTDDQKRVMTPGEAIAAGADYLVIGRPIMQPPSMTPLEAVELIKKEIEEALASR